MSLSGHLKFWRKVALLLAAAGVCQAEPASVAALTRLHCAGCHGPAMQTAGIDFERLLTARPLVRNRQTWERATHIIESGRMPPEGAPQLSVEERAAFLEALRREIEDFDYSRVDDPGFEPLRRLTHTEYDHTIRDLFGVDLKPSERFTAEMTGETGFDNSANTLFLQANLMERYIAAAERVVEDALPETPTTATHRLARERIYFDGSPEKVIGRFMFRAFRRPTRGEELARAMGHYRNARESGDGFEAAVRKVLAATLISPNFIFKAEAPPADDQPTRVTDWELASRLSYFFWATMPDDELFELASKNRLHEPETLARQVERMLADEKADTLGTVFAAQWLGFGHVGSRIRLGPIDFPWCTDSLMDSMRAESSLFFLSLLRENRPISELVDSDYTFVNQELAATLYAMEGVEGEQMRRVRLDDRRRGGVLGQGSILAVTSNYNQTSAVKRGHWILETLLGTPPPPPPPNAGVFDEKIGEIKDLSFREKLAMHSANESCRACHAKIDPLGLSLENYDYFGRWRDAYTFRIRIKEPEDAVVDEDSNFRKVTKEIDASGTLPEGQAFAGLDGLRRALLENRQGDLVRQTVSKMLAYALGRQLEYYDEPAVRKIISQLEANEYRFQTLLHGIVSSYPFLYKKNPIGEAN